MMMRRWLALIGFFVGCGVLQVAWQTAAIEKSYEVSERLSRMERLQIEVARVATEVVALESPAHLAQLSSARRLKLVAWSALPADRPMRLAAEYDTID